MTEVIKINELPTELAISPDWITYRDQLIAASAELQAVNDDKSFNDAADLLRAITKTSNKMESFRKEFAEPYQDAVKTIKKASDQARQDLENEKTRIKKLMSDFTREQERLARIERERIEKEQRERAERQAAAQEELGIDDPVQIPDAPAPTVRKPIADSARTTKVLKFNIMDDNYVPRAFCSPDSRLINAYLRDNKEKLIELIERDPRMIIIEGINITVEHQIASR